jgi:hypothetical protein
MTHMTHMTHKYLLVLDEEGQEHDHTFDIASDAFDAFEAAEDRAAVFSAALFEAKPQGKLLCSFERE